MDSARIWDQHTISSTQGCVPVFRHKRITQLQQIFGNLLFNAKAVQHHAFGTWYISSSPDSGNGPNNRCGRPTPQLCCRVRFHKSDMVIYIHSNARTSVSQKRDQEWGATSTWETTMNPPTIHSPTAQSTLNVGSRKMSWQRHRRQKSAPCFTLAKEEHTLDKSSKIGPRTKQTHQIDNRQFHNRRLRQQTYQNPKIHGDRQEILLGTRHSQQ
jgi:hypothetical protein